MGFPWVTACSSVRKTPSAVSEEGKKKKTPSFSAYGRELVVSCSVLAQPPRFALGRPFIMNSTRLLLDIRGTNQLSLAVIHLSLQGVAELLTVCSCKTRETQQELGLSCLLLETSSVYIHGTADYTIALRQLQ